MDKSKYNILSNIGYALKNIWIWDKTFFFWFFPSIPLEVFLSLMAIYFPKILIDAIEQQVSAAQMFSIIGIYFLVMFFADTWKRFCKTRRSSRRYLIGNRYELAIHEKFMRMDYANTENPNVTDKYFRAMGDIWHSNSAEDIWESILSFGINLLGVVTYGSIIFYISPLILFFLAISAAVSWAAGRFHIKWINANQKHWLSLDRKKNYISSFSKNFEYAKDIRIHRMSGWLDKRYRELIRQRVGWTKKLNAFDMAESFIHAALLLLQNILVYGMLCSMLFRGSISLSEFTFYFAAVTGFSSWLNNIIYGLNGLFQQGTAIGYYREYFAVKDQYRHAAGHALPKEKELPPEIEFEHVFFRYGEEDWLFEDVSFRIKPGEKLAIVGENGAGKTTLVKLLCGLYFPQKGVIRVNQIPTTEFCIEDYYSLFAAVFQDIHLLPISIREFVASQPEGLLDEQRVIQVLKQAGLSEKINSLRNGIYTKLFKGVYEDAAEFSGGEQQKLVLARALYKDAAVIILDEPTSALDPIAESHLYEQYHELTKNKTGIYISHRLASTGFCDRIFLLEHGRIAEEGSHWELMKKGGKYMHMYQLQSRYYQDTKQAKNDCQDCKQKGGEAENEKIK